MTEPTDRSLEAARALVDAWHGDADEPDQPDILATDRDEPWYTELTTAIATLLDRTREECAAVADDVARDGKSYAWPTARLTAEEIARRIRGGW